MSQVEDQIHATLPVIELAARLADEGLPVCAIARSLKVPSADIRTMLHEAIAEGIIVDYPREDWPPGQKRNSFGPALDNFVADEDSMRAACSRYFGTTRQQAIVLSLLLKRPEVTKEQLHQAIERDRPETKEQTSVKLVDVLICILRRKLKPHDLSIKTMWGQGYLMEAKDRSKAVKALNDFMKQTSNPVELAEAA